MKKNSYFYALTYMFLPLMALLVFTLIISALTGEPFSTAGYVALTVLTAVIVIIDVALLKDKTVGLVLLQIIFGIVTALFLLGTVRYLSGDEDLHDPEIAQYIPVIFLLGIIWIGVFVYNFISHRRFKREMKDEQAKTAEQGDAVEQTEAVEQKAPGKFVYVIRSLILVIGVLSAVSVFRYSMNEWRDIIVALATKGRTLSALKLEKVNAIAECLNELSWIGIAFWLAWVMKKAGFLTWEEQGFAGSMKPVKSMLMGMAVALVFTVGFVIMLYIQGCEVAPNNITAFYLLKIVCGILCQLGVAFIEEIQFRGIAIGYCRKHGLNVWGIVMSIVIFVSIHFDSFGTVTAVRVMYLLPLALLLTALRLYRKNTWISIGYHFMYNVIVTRVLETTRGGQIESFFRTMKITNWKFTIAILVPTLIMAVAVFAKMFVRAKREKADEN